MGGSDSKHLGRTSDSRLKTTRLEEMAIHAIMSLPQLRVLRRGQQETAAAICGAQSRPGLVQDRASVGSEPEA